jgi:regulator of RNase E activity RraA
MNELSPLSDVTLRVLEQVSTATLTTQLYKRGLRNVWMQGVAPLDRVTTSHLVGPAFTLRNIPAREDLATIETLGDPEFPQRKAIETVPPGYVLVQDCRGERNGASIGSILATRLKVRGVAGLVSDGPVRDCSVIAALGFPVFCSGASAPLNLIKHHPADINLPIGCGGVAVFPGDIIVGDGDGVVVVPRHLADEIATDAAEQEHLEDFLITLVQDGAPLRGTYPPSEETKAAYRAWKQKAAR